MLGSHLACLPVGSNGKEFTFLLKGHEDLRQDERVMQLFQLVNTLLRNDPITFKRHLRLIVIHAILNMKRESCTGFICSIQGYGVIPLSTNSGLIGWVPHCDTLHTLIRDYREKRKILLNVEHRFMLKASQIVKCCLSPWFFASYELPPLPDGS